MIRIIIALLILNACSKGGETTNPGNGGVSSLGSFFFAEAVASTGSLPTCGPELEGRIYYVQADTAFKSCSSSSWTDINVTGPQGPQGPAGNNGSNGANGDNGETFNFVFLRSINRVTASEDVEDSYTSPSAKTIYLPPIISSEWGFSRSGSVTLAFGSITTCTYSASNTGTWAESTAFGDLTNYRPDYFIQQTRYHFSSCSSGGYDAYTNREISLNAGDTITLGLPTGTSVGSFSSSQIASVIIRFAAN